MTISLLDFQHRGACRDADPELFFPVSETAANQPQIEQAKAVCARCPVLTECRAYALTNHIEGVWGGMSEDERRQARAREQQRQRELAASQATDTGESVDEPADSAPRPVVPVADTVPSYDTARQRLTRALRILSAAEETGDAADIETAHARVAAARQVLETARHHRENSGHAQGSEQLREYRAARNQLTRTQHRLEVARTRGEPDHVVQDLEQRVVAAMTRVEAAKASSQDSQGSEDLTASTVVEAVA